MTNPQKFWPSCNYCETWKTWHKSVNYCCVCGAQRPKPPSDWLKDLIRQFTDKEYGEACHDKINNFADTIRSHIEKDYPIHACYFNVSPSKSCRYCEMEKAWFDFLGIRKDGGM